MMNETKYAFSRFSFYDTEAMEERLEHMAAQGWMIQQPGAYLWKYRRIEPQKLRFTVTYFPAASDFNPAPTEGELAKAEFCALDGWELAASWGAMQIYCTRREDAVPIETDPVTQVKNLHRAMRKNVLFPNMILLISMGNLLFLQVSNFFRDPISALVSPSFPYLLLILTIGLLVCLHTLWFHFHWYRKARRAAEEHGVFLAIATHQGASLCLIALDLILLVLFLIKTKTSLLFPLFYIGGIVLAGVSARLLSRKLKRRGVSKAVNQMLFIGVICVFVALFTSVPIVLLSSHVIPLPGERLPVDTYEFHGVTFEIYDDPLPLELSDLMPAEGRWSREARAEENWFLSRTEYCQDPLLTEDPGLPGLEYTITRVKRPSLLAFCREQMLALDEEDVRIFRLRYEPLEAASYGVEEIYREFIDGDPRDNYLIFNGNQLTELRFFGTFTPEQVRTAVRILNGEN